MEKNIVSEKRKLKTKIRKGWIFAVGEIFLKSDGVQRLLRKRLINNLIFFLNREKLDFKIFPFRDRIFIEAEGDWPAEVLERTFGIVWFSKVFFFENGTLEDVSGFVKENYPEWVKSKESFALRVRRQDGIEESKEEIINRIASNIDRKVNLDNPKKEIFIEAKKEGWFVYLKKEKGAGGLPGGSQGKALSFVSGGIDSVPAAYLAARRGAENVWLHFHGFPLASKASIEKVIELARVFSNYQPRLKVYLLPFSEIQMKVKTNVPSNYRVLLYRRLMFRIGQVIAKKENCGALVTGESLGQVSSQTLTNINITQKGVKIPVFRPLIGLDKEEIIGLAKKIGTYEISIKPQEDCCTLFVSPHQSASGNIEAVDKFEKELNLKKLISKAVREAKIEYFSFFAILVSSSRPN